MATFNGTTKRDNFEGDSKNDVFEFDSDELSPQDRLSGGGGVNILNLTSVSYPRLTLNDSALKGLSHIDVISVEPNGGVVEFVLTDAFFRSNGRKEVVIDDSRAGAVTELLQVDATRVTKMSFQIAGSLHAQDTVRTGAGDDVFLYRYDAFNVLDVLNGGKGDDTLVFSGAGEPTPIKDGGVYTPPFVRSFLADVRNVENVVVTDLARGQTRHIEFGSLGGATYKGSGVISIETDAHYLDGKKAAAINGKIEVDGSRLTKSQALDVTGGNAGDDVIAGAAVDTLRGGAGSDTLFGGLGGDRIYGGSGNDVFVVSDAQLLKGGQFFGDRIDGGSGVDTLRFDAAEAIKLTAAAFKAGSFASVEKIVFTKAAAVEVEVSRALLAANHDGGGRLEIVGAANFFGGDGAFVVDASKNTDARFGVDVHVLSDGDANLKGGAGADIFDFTAPTPGQGSLTFSDKIVGGGGEDVLLAAKGTFATIGAGVQVERVEIKGGFPGGSTTEIGLAVKTATTVDGSGLKSSEALSVSGQIDVSGGFGQPDYRNATGRLEILGGAGQDSLSGGLARDVISGGAGDDQIFGWTGGDRLSGGSGADSFVYFNVTDSTVAASGRDLISGFGAGDKIVFLHDRTGPYSFSQDGSFHRQAGEVRTFVSGKSSFVELDSNGDGQADLAIELAGAPRLSAADFML